jgi:hypothetical protein
MKRASSSRVIAPRGSEKDHEKSRLIDVISHSQLGIFSAISCRLECGFSGSTHANARSPADAGGGPQPARACALVLAQRGRVPVPGAARVGRAGRRPRRRPRAAARLRPGRPGRRRRRLLRGECGQDSAGPGSPPSCRRSTSTSPPSGVR